MVRVIYRWKVPPENYAAFIKTWRDTTTNIRHMVDGAHGSVCMVSEGNKSDVVTMAKWDSIDAWKMFWGDANPKELYKMGQLGKAISVEVFDEIDDQTNK